MIITDTGVLPSGLFDLNQMISSIDLNDDLSHCKKSKKISALDLFLNSG